MTTAEASAGGVAASPEVAPDDVPASEAPSLFTREASPEPPSRPAPPALDPDFWGPQEVARERRRTMPVPATKPAPGASADTSAAPTAVPGPDGEGPTTEVAADAASDRDRFEARKVRRIIRHVSPWSVFKVSVLFSACMWVVLLIAGVLLWNVAQRTGVITNIEKFYAKSTGEQFHEIDGRGVFRSAAFVGAALAVASTGLLVLMSVLFNLITDLVGGIRVSVIELEHRRPRRR
jgi:hypothetical protein